MTLGHRTQRRKVHAIPLAWRRRRPSQWRAVGEQIQATASLTYQYLISPKTTILLVAGHWSWGTQVRAPQSAVYCLSDVLRGAPHSDFGGSTAYHSKHIETCLHPRLTRIQK